MKWVRLPRVLLAGLALAAGNGFASPAGAQDVPEQHVEAVALGAAPVEDQTLFNLSIGVTGNSGNTRAVSGNGGFNFLLKRSPHVFTLDALGTLGWANVLGDGTDSLQQNAGNIVGRARYDYFLSEKDALFAALVPRRDVFAGIGARIQLQAGYARVLYDRDGALRLWGEAGGDATIDRYVSIEQEDGSPSMPIDTEIYSVRLFLGYENTLSEAAQVKLGVEALLPPYDKRGEDGDYRYRINGNAELHSSLSSRFSMGASFRVLYDSSPPAGTPSEVDTITTFLLTYTYDSLAEKPAEEEEPACPPCESAEAAATAEAGGPETIPPAPAPADQAGGPKVAPDAPTEADTAPVDDEVSAPAPVDEEAAAEAADEAAAEAVEPAEEAAESGEAAAPPAGAAAAPVTPPAAGE